MTKFDLVNWDSLPDLYETLDIPFSEKAVYMHFFEEGADWFAVEHNPEEKMFYGYIDVRPGISRWGSFCLDMLDAREVQIDMNWKPMKSKEVPSIIGGEGRGW
jgi:hypothetical protein